MRQVSARLCAYSSPDRLPVGAREGFVLVGLGLRERCCPEACHIRLCSKRVNAIDSEGSNSD